MLWIEIFLDPRPEICPSLDPSLCFLFLTMWGPGSKFKIHKVDADPQQLITLLTWTYCIGTLRTFIVNRLWKVCELVEFWTSRCEKSL